MAVNGRKAKVTTVDELQRAIYDKLSRYGSEINIHDLLDNVPSLEKDLEKIDFGFEIFQCEPDDQNVLLGFHTIKNLTFLGCYAGGVWEHPVFFIIYLDHKGNIRGYIPREGNVYNLATKMAFGNDADDDIEALEDQFGLDEDEAEEFLENFGEIDVTFDYDRMIEDILDRITVIYTGSKSVSSVSVPSVDVKNVASSLLAESRKISNIKVSQTRKIHILDDDDDD